MQQKESRNSEVEKNQCQSISYGQQGSRRRFCSHRLPVEGHSFRTPRVSVRQASPILAKKEHDQKQERTTGCW
jgi:hypothetical protein